MFKRVVLALALAALPLQASALDNEDLLALVAMPLAVAAVSEVTDVPMNDLIDVITLMNDAAVPPAQFIEVVRYAPAVPNLDDVLRTEIQSGVRGVALVPVIEQQFMSAGIRDVDLDAPRAVTVIDEETFVPEVVRTHPHGGPPGQLKKAAGVQTGAEIVHGTHPGHGRNDAAARREPASSDRVVVRERRAPRRVEVHREHAEPKASRRVEKSHGGDMHEGRGPGKHGGGGHGHGGGGGHGGGKGHGKGKG